MKTMKNQQSGVLRKKNGVFPFFRKWALLAAFLLQTGCGGAQGFESFPEAPPLTDPPLETEAADPGDGKTSERAPEQTVVVHVCGAVAAPGVYELPCFARVYEAIEMAGGCREDASSESLNLALALSDGQRVYVPTKEEAAAGVTDLSQPERADAASGQRDGLVDLNRADRETLMTLPGIGEAKADSIIQYREENGGFHSIEEIMKIPGIKKAVYEKIREKIIV